MGEIEQCANCGVYPLPMATKQPLGISGSDVTAWACCDKCAEAHTVNTLSERPACVGFSCGNRVRPDTPGRGRPPMYCSKECHKETQRAIRQVLSRLARPKSLPESHAELCDLNNAYLYVHATWQHHGWQTRVFGKRVAENTIPVSQGMFMEWQRQQGKVAWAIPGALAEVHKVAAEKLLAQVEKERQERIKAIHGRDQQWRDNLATAIGDEPIAQTFSEATALSDLKLAAMAATDPAEQRRLLTLINDRVNA